MNGKPYICAISVLLVVFNGITLAQVRMDSPLEPLIRDALQRNPEILALEKSVAASVAQIPQAGALPDPMIKFGLMNLPVNSFEFDQEPMTGKQIMLTQRLPFPGTLSLQTKVSRQMATVADTQLRSKECEVIRKVKEVCSNLIFVKQAIRITEKNLATLEQFHLLAQTKYEVGEGLQQDVLRAQVELLKMNEKIVVLRQQERSLKAMLNTFLDRSPGEPVEELPEPSFTPFTYDEDSLHVLTEANNPTLKMMKARLAAASSLKGLAGKGYFPQIDVSVAYTQREDILDRTMHDFFTAQVGFSLPLWFWRNQKKKVEAAEHRIWQVKDELENARNMVRFDIADLEIQRNEKEKLIELYRDGILLQGEQSIRSALVAYQVNKVDFLTILNMQKRLFDDETAYERIRADREIILAKIEETVGKRLF